MKIIILFFYYVAVGSQLVIGLGEGLDQGRGLVGSAGIVLGQMSLLATEDYVKRAKKGRHPSLMAEALCFNQTAIFGT
jgi:hypothetical protein